MQGVKKAWGNRKVWVGIALVCTAAALASGVTIATATDGDPGSPEGASISPEGASKSSSGGERSPASASVSTHERVQKHEVLPCTGPKDPINFEIFSAGPSVAGLPLNSVQRRCGGSTPEDEPPANFTNYIYGHCEIAESATGCAPPLEIQTWPACQRALGDYSFEGKPVPYRRLPSRGGAEVVEINFMLDRRIEVYSKSSTVVIFAENSDLANKALGLLRSQEEGKPPITQADQLGGEPEGGLEPPSDGATEGELSCQS